MTQKIKVIFKLNKELDKKMASAFINHQAAGINFSRGIFEVHPEIKFLKKEKNKNKIKKEISKHFDYFYQRHKEYLIKRVNEFNLEWSQVNDNFWSEMNKIFKGYKISGKKYIGYLSIIDCNPRFLKANSFQIFYFHPLGVKYVTAHELMHFIFYAYAVKKYPSLFKGLDTENGLFWEVAEIFNAIVLKDLNLIKIHGVQKQSDYPDHLKFLPSMLRFRRRNHDTDKLILKIYQLVNHSDIMADKK